MDNYKINRVKVISLDLIPPSHYIGKCEIDGQMFELWQGIDNIIYVILV